MSNLANRFNSGFLKRATEVLGPGIDKRALDAASQYALAAALGGGAGAAGGYFLTPEEEEENQTRNALLGALAGAGGGAALNYGLTRGAPAAPAPAAPAPPATNATPILSKIIDDMGEGEDEEYRQLSATAPRPKVVLPPEALFTPIEPSTDSTRNEQDRRIAETDSFLDNYQAERTLVNDEAADNAYLAEIKRQEEQRKNQGAMRRGELKDAQRIGKDLEKNPYTGKAITTITALDDRSAAEALAAKRQAEETRLAVEEAGLARALSKLPQGKTR
jgi:hypothetical protein